MRSAAKRSERGFTLLELLVVLAIMGLLAAIVGPQVLKYLGSSKSQAARIQAKQIAVALEHYRVDTGSYPSAEQGLNALAAAPPSAPAWNGPYLQPASALMDPWGEPYRFAAPGKHGEIDVFSYGSDKAEGGSGEAQDVGNW